MSMYNLIDCNDNYSDTSGSLWRFKNDEVPNDNADLGVENNGNFNSQTFKYKEALVGKTKDVVNNTNSSEKKHKNSCSIKNSSNFCRSLEMPLVSCKVNLELNWTEDCILPSAGDSARFKITDPNLHVPIVTLSTKDNVNLSKQLSNGIKRSVYWNN